MIIYSKFSKIKISPFLFCPLLWLFISSLLLKVMYVFLHNVNNVCSVQLIHRCARALQSGQDYLVDPRAWEGRAAPPRTLPPVAQGVNWLTSLKKDQDLLFLHLLLFRDVHWTKMSTPWGLELCLVQHWTPGTKQTGSTFSLNETRVSLHTLECACVHLPECLVGGYPALDGNHIKSKQHVFCFSCKPHQPYLPAMPETVQLQTD